MSKVIAADAAEHLLHRLDVGAGRHRQAGRGVPKVVRRGARDASLGAWQDPDGNIITRERAEDMTKPQLQELD